MDKLLSIKLTKLSSIVILGFITMLVMLIVFLFLIYKAANKTRDVSINALEVISITRIIGDASDYLTNQAGLYAVTGDKVFYDNYWHEVNETKRRDKTLDKLKNLNIPQDILDIVEDAKRASDSLIKIEEEAFENVKEGNLKKATELMFGPRYKEGKSMINDKLDNFEKSVLGFVENDITKIEFYLAELIIICGIAISISSVIFILFITMFLRGMTTSMDNLSKLFKYIADGDMTISVPVKEGNSEIYRMYYLMSIFIANIRDILKNVMAASEEVASGNNELAATMEELSATFVSQSEQVQGTASRMDGINTTVKETVDKLSDSSNTIEKTVESAGNGKSQLINLRNSMQSIHTQANSLSSTISKLSDSSAEIGNIITVINDIADQTNLLALNAAIEAARAGDAGRGFAVVADEVRKLAERTQKATGEVTNIISALQNESEAASEEMADASEKVMSGVSLINDTETVFNDIFGSIEHIKYTTQTLTGDISKEYDVINEINMNTRNVAAGIDESSGAVAEVTKTVAHLQERVNNLKTMVSKFKV